MGWTKGAQPRACQAWLGSSLGSPYRKKGGGEERKEVRGDVGAMLDHWSPNITSTGEKEISLGGGLRDPGAARSAPTHIIAGKSDAAIL